MPNPLGLYFDGDLRRVYEVPENSSFVVDGGGFRTYTPDDIPSASTNTVMTATYMWSRYVDWHSQNLWSTKTYRKDGGNFRFNDALGNPVYAGFDIRLINGWELVPANYPHNWLILGNLFGDETTGRDFDTERLTAQGVSPRIQFADSLQTLETGSAPGLTSAQEAIMTRMLKLLEADELLQPGRAQLLDRDTGDLLLDKNVSGGNITEEVRVTDVP